MTVSNVLKLVPEQETLGGKLQRLRAARAEAKAHAKELTKQVKKQSKQLKKADFLRSISLPPLLTCMAYAGSGCRQKLVRAGSSGSDRAEACQR